MWWLLFILVLMFGLFNWIMGYQKGNIILDLDERYFNWNKHVEATKAELEEQGREVVYNGNGEFNIDGKSYLMIERNVRMGVPLQRTILKIQKDEK